MDDKARSDAHHVVKRSKKGVGNFLLLVDNKTEVRKTASIRCEKNVFRLDVPMNEAKTVQKLQGTQHPQNYKLRCNTLSKGSKLPELPKGTPNGSILQADDDLALLNPGSVQTNDVGML